MAQQQKELLERQAAAIQEGTDKVLAAQQDMIKHLRTKQKEDDARVMLLMTKLGELETALKHEKIRCLEFEKDLLQERQNKRRTTNSPEEAPDGRRARPTGHALITGLSRVSTVLTHRQRSELFGLTDQQEVQPPCFQASAPKTGSPHSRSSMQ